MNAAEKVRKRRLAAILAAGGVFALVAVAVVWASLPEGPLTRTPMPLPDEVGVDPKFGAALPGELVFRDEQGRDVELAQFVDGKPILLTLVYYRCPMLCNMTMDGLVRGLKGLKKTTGDDFTVLTVSFDPREEPPLAAAAKQTALDRYDRSGAAAGWHFLTGEQDSIAALASAVGFHYEFDEQSGQYAHAAGLFVLSPEGKLSRFLGGVEFSPRDLNLALTETDRRKSATLTDQVLMLCFHYDPANGRYGLAIWRLMRLAGVTTAVVLGATIFTLARREPNRATSLGSSEGLPREGDDG